MTRPTAQLMTVSNCYKIQKLYDYWKLKSFNVPITFYNKSKESVQSLLNSVLLERVPFGDKKIQYEILTPSWDQVKKILTSYFGPVA